MKIAFLNPWRNAAENQAFSSLRIAAERVGHKLVHCSNSAEVEDCKPDFVLASASTQPKLNDVPHYGVIHEPRDRFFTNRDYFYNFLSYDGYLTIADTLERFIRDVTFGAGDPKPAGFYYNTCQRQHISANLRDLLQRRELRITYFGTNWDKRRQAFFQALSRSEGVQIHGPDHCWPHISPDGYGGPIPFDGASVQARYAANGIGLCMLSDFHLRDDIISNRLFEITSVGSIALCCDIPWIRKHFHNNVYYFDQTLNDDALKAAILELRELVYRNPEDAIAKANRAREIFESHFAAEVMIENAVRYHERMTSCRSLARKKAEEKYSPLVSVIVRCGSRETEFVKRAIESIERQTYGRFEVIFVKHRDIDLSFLDAYDFSRIVRKRTIECLGGNRAASLWAGLHAVDGEYFSILDDDDWWFSGHMEQLFKPLPDAPLKKFMAYSGIIAVLRDPVPIDGGGCDDRHLHRFGIESVDSWSAATSAFASNCFVASSDLLHPRLMVCPQMETAEDSYLILSLLAQLQPRFSYAATSIYDRSLTQHSSFAEHPSRYEDELSIQLRLLGRDRPRFLTQDTWMALSEYWGQRKLPGLSQGETGEQTQLETILRDWEEIGGGFELKGSALAPESRSVNPATGAASIQTPSEPWSYGAALLLRRPREASPQYTLIVELVVHQGKVGVGILNQVEGDFLCRQAVAASIKPQTLRIDIDASTTMGRLVIQNWEGRGVSVVELISLRLMSKPAKQM